MFIYLCVVLVHTYQTILGVKIFKTYFGLDTYCKIASIDSFTYIFRKSNLKLANALHSDVFSRITVSLEHFLNHNLSQQTVAHLKTVIIS